MLFEKHEKLKSYDFQKVKFRSEYLFLDINAFLKQASHFIKIWEGVNVFWSTKLKPQQCSIVHSTVDIVLSAIG